MAKILSIEDDVDLQQVVAYALKKKSWEVVFAYDGKDIGDSRQVVLRNLDKLPAANGIVPGLLGAQGSQVDNFREHLLFGITQSVT